MLQIIKDQILPLIGTITAIIIFSSPYKQVAQVYKTNVLGSLNPVPHAMMAVNGLVWYQYGLYTDNFWLSSPNMLGIVLGLGYTLVCYSACSRDKQLTILEVLLSGYLVTLTTSGITIIGFKSGLLLNDPKLGQSILGGYAVAVLLLFYTSPLTEIVHAIRKKDAKVFSIPLAIACLINGIVWAFYGFLLGDVSLWLPNLVGVVCALLQLILKLIFKEMIHNEEVPLQR